MDDVLRLDVIDNFFTTYKAKYPDHFNILFGDDVSEDVSEDKVTAMDWVFVDIYGDKILKNGLSNVYRQLGKETAVDRVVILCDTLNYESWKATKDLISEAYNSDIVYPIKAKNTKVTEREGEETDTTQNKENAFDNTETASNTDSSESNGTHNETITVTETKERSNQKTVFANASEGIEFTKYNDYIKMIMNDIANEISLTIY